MGTSGSCREFVLACEFLSHFSVGIIRQLADQNARSRTNMGMFSIVEVFGMPQGLPRITQLTLTDVDNHAGEVASARDKLIKSGLLSAIQSRSL